MLGLNSESGSGFGLELGCIQYIKLLIQYIKLLIQYTINWVAFENMNSASVNITFELMV